MIDETPQQASAAPADPVGTPPAGGRWTWDGSWVRLPEVNEPGDSAAADSQTTPKE